MLSAAYVRPKCGEVRSFSKKKEIRVVAASLWIGFEVGRKEEERRKQLTSVSNTELASAAEAQWI